MTTQGAENSSPAAFCRPENPHFPARAYIIGAGKTGKRENGCLNRVFFRGKTHGKAGTSSFFAFSHFFRRRAVFPPGKTRFPSLETTG